MINLHGRRVMVTGASSMIGRAVCASLEKRGARLIKIYHSVESLKSAYNLDGISTVCDLEDAQDMKGLRNYHPEFIIHAAGWNGGIEWNRKYPATIFGKNTRMALNVLEFANIAQVSKILSILPSCAYPTAASDDALCEESLLTSEPNPSVACHGFAKRNLAIYSQFLGDEFGLNATTCLLTNSYGPYDSFHPLKTKVVAATIKKLVDAKREGIETIDIWGTGKPLREFMFSEDAGESIVMALERYQGTDTINIGSGQEVSILELYETVKDIIGWEGEFNLLSEKGDGQMRKLLDLQKAYGWGIVPEITPFRTGLERTIEWYEEQYPCN